MFKLSLFILFALHIHNSSCIVDHLYDAGNMVWNLYLILDKIGMGSNTSATQQEEIFSLGKVKNQKIKIQMNEIFDKLDKIERPMNSKKISDSLGSSSSSLILYACMQQLQKTIEEIDDIHEEFQKYMKEECDNSKDALDDLLQKIEHTKIRIIWIRRWVIEKSISSTDCKDIITTISLDVVHRHDELCSNPQLTTSVLAQLFRMVVIAEIKANFMLSLANIYQYEQNNEIGWSEKNSLSTAEFKKNFASYVAIFNMNINATDDLYFQACDPIDGIWTRNENFYELEGAIQTTIFNYHWAACKFSSCNDVWSDGWERCSPARYDERTSCSHTIDDCQYLAAIETCVLRSGPYRFQYMKSTKLGNLGRNFTCPEDNGYIYEDGKGWDFIYSACACDCYGDDNKISLSIMESRIEYNWVITGLRFFRKHGILHIQPREGKLEANGYISPFTQRWIPIPKNPQIHTISKNSRIFFLDDLRLPSSHTLTGMKFNKVISGGVTCFAIEIFGVPCDEESGRCQGKDIFEVSVKASYINTRSSIEFRRVPSTHERVSYTPTLSPSGYVSLERSEFSADFGQSTLPFFDAASIAPNPPSVLGGVGIFHKGADGYAGFISLRIFGIRYGTYLSDFQNENIANGSVLFTSSEHN